MNFQNKTEFLNSLVKKEDEVKKALTKLYQGVRATNKFLGLENSPELQSTYFMLRQEEVGELFTAIENEDKVEFLDAVVDGLVVVGYEYFLKYMKPEKISGWKIENKQDIDEVVYEISTSYKCELGYDDSLSYLEIIFSYLDIDHMKAVNEVLESNWSKFPTVSKLVDGMVNSNGYLAFHGMSQDYGCSDFFIKEQIKIIETQGRYVDIYHELRYDESVGEERVIFWAKGEKQKDDSIKEFKAPKYVKPTATFKEPDFASCWLN